MSPGSTRADKRSLKNDCPTDIGEAYNIGTGEAISIRALAEVIQDLTDTESDIVHVEGREGDIEDSVADIEKASEFLEYEPAVGLEDGLNRTIEGYRDEER